MNRDGGHIDYDKIARYLAGEAEVQERMEMEAWINASEDNKKVFDESRQLFALDYSGLRKEDVTPFDTAKAWVKVKRRAGITLPDSSGEAKVLEMPEEKEKTGFDLNKLWIGIAAAIIIGISITFLLLDRKPEQIYAGNETGTREIFLPDSTRVVLKDVATLTFDTDYNKKHRDVAISGTAYLDVTENGELPFIISTANGRVAVLGTAFMIEETDEGLELTVERGRVQLSSKVNPDVSVILERNQKAILRNNDSIDLRPIASMNTLFWATNTLTYRQINLAIVFNELSQIFDVPIEFSEEDIANCRITGVFKDETLESIISNMALSMDFEYNFDGTTYQIISDGCDSN